MQQCDKQQNDFTPQDVEIISQKKPYLKASLKW